MEDFVHLHVHTYFSILDGQSSIEKLVKKAIGDGMKGMAITDHGEMFGIKEFTDYCARINKDRKKEGKEPFVPIIGCEVYVARHRKEDKVKENGDKSGYHLILLAKNYQGYKNLIKLVSRAWVDGYYFRPRTDRTDLETYHEGLIACSACIAGEVPKKIINDNIAGAREAIEWYKRVFGEDYYLELQRHEVTDPNIMANRETFPLQQKANKVLIELAHEYGIQLICTNDSHFVDKENAEAHDHLLCLSTESDLDDPNRMRYSKQEWFKTKKEMNAVFSDIPEALRNTVDILKKIEIYSIDHDPIMPFFPIPEEFGTEDDIRRKYTEEQLLVEFTSDENGANTLPREEGEKKIKHLGGYDKLYRIKFEAEYLKKLTYDGAKKLYGDPVPENVVERINFELHIMKTMGFPGYFLIVQDFINAARDQLDVMVGPGRGSAAGSVVAYCLGITRIDPIKYDLLFERFLNPDRISLPDIDTDFDDDGRGRVLKWVEDKYGHDKVAHIITYSTMATKKAIQDIARVEKLPPSESSRLCKSIPERMPNKMKLNLVNAIQVVPELREAEMSNDKRLSNTIKYAKMLEGTVRGTGIHACGTIICRDAISDWVPVSTANDPENKGEKVLCTQYDGHVIESTGLIKMDFLGLKTLSELKDAIDNIYISHGVKIDIENIPIDDQLTYELYQRGRTVGTFQFESPGMQKHLRELKPTVFEDLIAMNALYRPGPMQYIPDFIERKNNPAKITYDIPCMEEYLKDTYGITVYQEQVMLLSRKLADFTRGESDALRKAMGKKKKEIVDQMKPKFIEGGVRNGHNKEILEKIWSDWEAFAEYAFNKSHATCYSWIAYQTAYLKAHYPAEYMSAIMSRRKDDIKEITKLMDECRAMNIPTLGPDINESHLKFGTNKKGEIRFGLAGIKGVGESASEAIINEREKNGPYKDIFDFIQRVSLNNVNKKVIESIVFSGGFDCFGIQREAYISRNNKGESFIELLIRYGQLYQAEKNNMQNSLFGGLNSVDIQTPKFPQVEEMSNIEKLNKERELVGIYLSAHPLDEYNIILNYKCNTKCHELSENIDLLASRSELTFGGIITNVKEDFTKNGEPYGFVSIEDYEGVGNIRLFGGVWGTWKGFMTKGSIVFVRGKSVPRYHGSKFYSLVISSVQYMQEVKEVPLNSITINMDISSLNEQIVDEMTSVINDNPGNVPINIRIHDTESNQFISLKSRLHKIKPNKTVLDYLQATESISYYLN